MYLQVDSNINLTWVDIIPPFSKLSRHYFHWMPRHSEGTWKKIILLKNIAKHIVYYWQKPQVVRTVIELMVSKVVKVSHFQTRSAYNFVGRRKKRPKNPAEWVQTVIVHSILLIESFWRYQHEADHLKNRCSQMEK